MTVKEFKDKHNKFLKTGELDKEYAKVLKGIYDLKILGRIASESYEVKLLNDLVKNNFFSENPELEDIDFEEVKRIVFYNMSDYNIQKKENLLKTKKLKEILHSKRAIKFANFPQDVKASLKRDIYEYLPECIFKSSGDINYTKLGKVFDVSHHTMKRWCNLLGIKPTPHLYK